MTRGKNEMYMIRENAKCMDASLIDRFGLKQIFDKNIRDAITCAPWNIIFRLVRDMKKTKLLSVNLWHGGDSRHRDAASRLRRIWNGKYEI